jgi:hypothetical protein
VKNRPQADETGESACPTIGSKQLALVAQAVSPGGFACGFRFFQSF